MESSGTHSRSAPHRLRARDGVTLAFTEQGPPDGPAVLFAHGFGQSRTMWARTAAALAACGWRTLAFDARGHGDSGRVADGAYRLEQFVDDLVMVAASLPAPPVLVGHSMGGLLGIAAAGEVRPAPFRALVLVDITPRWETDGVARILDFMRAHLDGFASLEDAAEQVAAYAPRRPRRQTVGELAQLMRRDDDGRWRWQWDPALLDTIAHEGEHHQQRLVEAARHIGVPVLLVSGGRSDVISERTVAEFLAAVPDATHVRIADATHAVAGDDNNAFTTTVASFLETLDKPGSRRGVRRGKRESAGVQP